VIIKHVLDLFQDRAERLRCSPEPFIWSVAIHEVILLLQPSARQKGCLRLRGLHLFLPTHFIGRSREVLLRLLTTLIRNQSISPKAGMWLIAIVGLKRQACAQGQVHVTLRIPESIPSDKTSILLPESIHQVEVCAEPRFEGTATVLCHHASA